MPADPRACTCAPNAVSIECPVHGAATRAHLLDAIPRATPTAVTSTFEMGVQAGAREGYDRGVRDTLERLVAAPVYCSFCNGDRTVVVGVNGEGFDRARCGQCGGTGTQPFGRAWPRIARDVAAALSGDAREFASAEPVSPAANHPQTSESTEWA